MKVIDNFLPEDVFNSAAFQSVLGTNVPWYYSPAVVDKEDTATCMFFHYLYRDNTVLSDLYAPIMTPILGALQPRALIRSRFNALPKTSEIVEYKPHVDDDFVHSVLVFYMNTCDGYTKFADGTIVESVANRALIFNGNMIHQGTTCTDQQARFVLNVNFIEQQFYP